MSRFINIILIFIIIGVVSCKLKGNSSIDYVINYINNCVDGSNQIDIDEKAYYDNSSETLINYTGKSRKDYIVKYEIPMKELNPDSIILDESTGSGNTVTVFTRSQVKAIRYYKQGILISTTNRHTYYLGFCWKREIEKQHFVESLRKVIIAIANSH